MSFETDDVYEAVETIGVLVTTPATSRAQRIADTHWIVISNLRFH